MRPDLVVAQLADEQQCVGRNGRAQAIAQRRGLAARRSIEIDVGVERGVVASHRRLRFGGATV
jgi:hypothetical protein